MSKSRHIPLLRYEGSSVGEVKNVLTNGVQNNLFPYLPQIDYLGEVWEQVVQWLDW